MTYFSKKGDVGMIYSNDRKLCLSGWLKKYNEAEYNNPLKLQKFLLLYEAFSKTAGEEYDFSSLRGYKRGPVFSNVWGDYTKERMLFNQAAAESCEQGEAKIDAVRAKKCAFVVQTMTEKELSELTHRMNLWRSKEQRIMKGEYQVALHESDFNAEDEAMVKLLDEMYPVEMIERSSVINLDKSYFVFKKEDVQRLTEEHFDVLMTLTEQEELHNPVYVDIDEEGRLIID